MSSESRVFIVDDDEAVRDSIAALLQSEGIDVEAFGTAKAFLSGCSPEERGCVLLDVRMPEMDGLTLQQRIAEGWPGLSVVMMTGHGDVPIAVQAMKAGAVDFIEKPFDEARLVAVVRQALARSASVSAEAEEAQRSRARLALLSTREREVLEGLVAGLPNKTIAYQLQISPRTVEIYRARLMDKMQANSLSNLVRMAVIAGVKAKSGPDAGV